MATQNLRDIRAFPELVRYLEEELDWPLQDYEFDDLTFEYTPSELGLKEEDAARIKAIHQLRPLASGQPWGIFFVEFENKKLPVVVLRRILSHLAVKKRASANKASAPAWHAEDLLFITAFGEDNTDAREIAFAHFHQNPGDMPTLHVLGWDGGDTPLKLANVDHVLRERLRWPTDEKNSQAWRETWSKPFRHRIGHVITTASLLAEELASLARGIRDKAKVLLAAESEKGEITKLFKAFQTALIHDLTPESFADTYAQTITYGLLTAAISRTDKYEGGGTALIAENVVDMVPVTNPFLKEMLQTFLKVGGRKGGIDFDELGIQDVVNLLRGDETDLPAILRDFGNKTRGEDPVIHFYEHFLSAYNKKLKIQRGVFYTPQPVVSYIVRSVHELLQTEFGLEDGLASTITWGEMAARQIPPSPPFSKGGAIAPRAEEGENNNKTESFPPLKKGGEGGFKIPEGTSPDEPFVVILDPATGTATFLVEVINVIHRTLTEKWTRQGMNPTQRLEAWNDYVPKHLLPRLYGYELMMAPYAIAHMKIGLKLAETGYRFASNERVRIYLTNALEPWQRQLKLPDFEALAHEAVAVNDVKREKRFTVIVGNPPYSGHSINNQLAWIVDKVHDYKRGLPDLQKPGQAKWLQDDYVKFLRLAEWIIQQSAIGVVGMITNHSFLDNPTFRGLRRSLINSFSSLRFLDLHGNSKGREIREGMTQDDNVFDIQQGVGVSLLVAGSIASGTSYGELWGNRDSKYGFLQKNSVGSIQFEKLVPVPEYYLFIRQDANLRTEYENGISIHKAMGENGDPAPGIVTTQDEFAIAFTKTEMREHIAALIETETEKEARELFRLCTQSQWNYANAKRELNNGDWVNDIEPILYRPFDKRWTVFNPHVAVHRRLRVMRHLRAWKNLAIVTTRSVEIGRGFEHVFCTRGLIQHHTVSLKEVNFVIPLYLRPDPSDLGFSKEERYNLSPGFLSRLSRSLSIPQESVGGLPHGLKPEDIFHYAYAVFHSPGYRTRYAEFLKIDFPRLPLTGNLELFRALAQLGGELVALHLLESPKVNDFITRFEGKGDNGIPKKPTYKDGAVWINASQRFEGVPEAVWNFHIGGYQVCEKWLKDRKGRILSDDDIAHYQRVVVALNETIRIMAEIDQVIETHGGWPGAFQSSAGEVEK